MANCKIININNVQSLGMTDAIRKSAEDLPLTKCLKSMINDLETEINNRIHDVGYFSDFSVKMVKNKVPDFWGKELALFVEKDTQKEGSAYLGVSVLHPTMAVERPVYLAKGDRKKLIEYIKRENFEKELEQTVNSIVESLKTAR